MSLWWAVPETHTRSQATQHDCLPSLLSDWDKWFETVYREEKIFCLGQLEEPRRDKNILYRHDKRTKELILHLPQFSQSHAVTALIGTIFHAIKVETYWRSGLKLVCNVIIVYGNLKSENSQDYAQKTHVLSWARLQYCTLNLIYLYIYSVLIILPRLDFTQVETGLLPSYSISYPLIIIYPCHILMWFRHDARGNLTRVNWSHFARDSFLNVDIEKVKYISHSILTVVPSQTVFI